MPSSPESGRRRWARPGDTPLTTYLRAQATTERELARLLRAAAREAEQRVAQGLRGYTGVRGVQYSVTSAALRELSRDLWAGVDTTVRRGIGRATAAAAEDAAALVDRYLAALTPAERAGHTAAEVLRALRAGAANGADAVIARGANGIPLSEQVYRTRALASGWVDRRVSYGLATGRSAAEIAADVRAAIRPDVPGGAAYAARRLGRTELNNAFHTMSRATGRAAPFVLGQQWNLSGTHGAADECDDMAHSEHYAGYGPGVYAADDVPDKPHPQCLCYITSVTVPDEEFAAQVRNGEYDDYLATVDTELVFDE